MWGVGPGVLVRVNGTEWGFGHLSREVETRECWGNGRGSSGLRVPKEDPTIVIRGYCKR